MGSQSRESGFKSSCFRFEVRAFSFTPRCPSSLGCIKEDLAMDCSGCVNEQSLHSNCSIAECSPESRVGVGVNRSARG